MRALKTSVDFSYKGYGKVEPGDLVELDPSVAKILEEDGQFERVSISKKATYVTKVEMPEAHSVQPEEAKVTKGRPKKN